MTETFWIAATVLILVALAFVLYPIFFHGSRSTLEIDQRNQNLLAYRSRLKELDNEYEAGILEDENYQLLKDELAGAMLDDVPEHAKPEQRIPGRRSAMAIALMAVLLLPAGAFIAYERWGAMDQVEQYLAMQEMSAVGDEQVAKVSELAEQLRTRLETNPGNADGWAMLGQTYMRIERFRDAADAFRNLATAVAEDSESSAVALGLAAQALFFDNEGKMTPEVVEAIEAAQSLNPSEVNSLGLLGINAFSQQDYQAAIEYWEQIVAVAPDHPQIDSIRGGIDESYRRLGQQPSAAVQSQSVPVTEAGPGVSLRVSLDDDFRDQVPADTTLFIFARSANTAEGAPVAVARLTAGALPADIRLDDRYAMSPNATISAEQDVVIIARLSRSGSVNPQPGDWQGRVEAQVMALSAQPEPVQLVINQELTN
ncbi:c-type cytochrome biogenesis protein CcmI [Marinobacter sp.]|uniref:c-type cytochrome biogenesis protein CcmI n=1 Tax=Marinobacter sp. TaxID=50741 RepID=UPI0019F71A89|nr:c-type cytochrome biogenesis protein CcmI [Marinobacter sp.]MBE0485774.1 c-type cytochrome biogenesis protein CcmI [Marinobacter sp.]